MNTLPVQKLEQDREHHLELTLMAGRNGLKKKITHSQVQKMGLALTGFIQFIIQNAFRSSAILKWPILKR